VEGFIAATTITNIYYIVRFPGFMYFGQFWVRSRIENIFKLEPYLAAIQLRELIKETVQLVELHMPLIDTSQVRSKLDWRHEAWTK
jgi:hypothetical protein